MTDIDDSRQFPTLRHTGIVVTDLDRALTFYRDLLGFVIWREDIEEGPYIDHVVGMAGTRLRWVKLRAPGGGTIELLQYLSHPVPLPVKPAPNLIGASHIAITVPDIDGLIRLLADHGYEVVNGPARSPDGRAVVTYARDPDGTIIELVEEITDSSQSR